jgi:hypothetical protein
MPRLTTWLVVGLIALLGTAAAVDALRGGDERAEPAPATTAPRPAETQPDGRSDQIRAVAARLLQERGVSGQLLVSDEDCNVQALRLPTLEDVEPPFDYTCRFTQSPGGRVGFDPAYRGPGSLVAVCRDETVIIAGTGEPDRTVLAICPPAWTPDGRLTVVSQGELREVDIDCRGGRSCTEVVLSQEDLRAALGRVPWEMTRPQIRSAAWLSRDRVAVVVRDLDRDLDAIAVFEGRELLGAPPFLYEFLTDLRASPRGGYAAALLNRRALVVVDGNGEYQPLTLRGATGLAWSPDERWIAAATGREIFVAPVEQGATGPVLVPIRATDVAWVGE